MNRPSSPPPPPIYRFDLSALLSKRHLSQREAAQMCGLSKNAISILCGDPSQIQVSTINKLCQGLGVTIQELFATEE